MTREAVLKRWHGLSPNLQGACWMLLTPLPSPAWSSAVQRASMSFASAGRMNPVVALTRTDPPR